VEGQSDWVVVEADEYDRSFLHLHPLLAVVNSVDPDHLDIYGTAEAVVESYSQFARQTDPQGAVFLGEQVGNQINGTSAKASSFGTGTGWTHRAENIWVAGGAMVFDYTSDTYGHLPDLRLPYPGLHNIRNAVAAITVTLAAGGDRTKIAGALADFKGVKRRFETLFSHEKTVLVDDYAHHPAELEAAIGAARMLYPDRHLTGIFQPHLYSRTRDFAAEFAAALDGLDECILLDIYPARELPIPGVDSAMIAGLMHNPKVTLATKKNLIETLNNRKKEVVMTMGAGDIDTLLEQILTALQKDLFI